MGKLATAAVLVTTVLVMACSCSGDDGAGATDNGSVADTTSDVAADPGTDPASPADVANPDVAPDTTTPADAAVDTSADVPPLVDPKCAALTAGLNSNFDVDGKKRAFLLNLPDRATLAGPWPVVFNWHGFGDTAQNMSFVLSGNVNDATYPFILVTPDDLGALPPNGMDWQILKVTDKDPDVRLFDEILLCLDQVYGVDPDRVHVLGFSAGAIMSDLLGVMRGDQIASILSFSGTYFSNPPNKEALGNFASLVTWPEMTAGPTYVQMLVHGGAADNYNLGTTTLKFNENGARDVPYLNGLGHDVIHCDHGGVHTVPVGFMQGQIVRFFEAHPRGVATSWADGGIPAAANLPAYCTPSPAP